MAAKKDRGRVGTLESKGYMQRDREKIERKYLERRVSKVDTRQ